MLSEIKSKWGVVIPTLEREV